MTLRLEKIAFLLLIASYMLPLQLAIILQGIVWLIIAYLTIKSFKENKSITILILSTIIVVFTFFVLR